MSTDGRDDGTDADPIDGFAQQPAPNRYVLRLYVAGLTATSITAISRLKAVCEQHLSGRYDLEVIDIYQRPELARKAQIIAMPTLVRELPSPVRKLIGDLSDQERILAGLDVIRQDMLERPEKTPPNSGAAHESDPPLSGERG